MHRDPKDPYALDHAFVGLVKGMEENYAWKGQHWPNSRCIVIGLSFDMQGEETPGPWIEGWGVSMISKPGHSQSLATSTTTMQKLSSILSLNELHQRACGLPA